MAISYVYVRTGCFSESGPKAVLIGGASDSRRSCSGWKLSQIDPKMVMNSTSNADPSLLLLMFREFGKQGGMA
uniref:Uncharacterized protein n=1 Tax=Oryza sativa subsp. japonica TaxID=39947 RepID=Q2RAQ2_ORYSJ|nr:hypothetical protein LOC_Os11g04630 [Oryza sativa Japonica Group]